MFASSISDSTFANVLIPEAGTVVGGTVPGGSVVGGSVVGGTVVGGTVVGGTVVGGTVVGGTVVGGSVVGETGNRSGRECHQPGVSHDLPSWAQVAATCGGDNFGSVAAPAVATPVSNPTEVTHIAAVFPENMELISALG
jgi:hypothetical protein